MSWSIDYSNGKLPSRLKKNGVEYDLQMTSGYYPYILNYAGFESPYDDRPTVAIQAFGDTENEAAENMITKLRELGLDI